MTRHRGLLVGALTTATVACFLSLVYPVYVIRPFRSQGPQELIWALTVTRYRGVITAVCALVAIGAALAYSRFRPKRWKVATAGVAAAGTCAFAALTHVNIYELMFHPNSQPSFSAAAKSKLDSEEKVIAVRLGTQARAYPIRSMSYHHVINDVVGRVAIAATY